MHDAIYHLSIIWHLLLLALLAFRAVKTDELAERTLALDALTLVMVPLLAILAIGRAEVGYLDVAIAVALLGFVQTIAIARMAERRKELR